MKTQNKLIQWIYLQPEDPIISYNLMIMLKERFIKESEQEVMTLKLCLTQVPISPVYKQS